MHLLDTDTLSHLHSGHRRVLAHLRGVPGSLVGTTLITKIEILRARHAFVLKASSGEQLLEAQRWLEESEALLGGMLVVSISEQAAHEFNRLRKNRKLRSIGRADLLIASIALANDATIVTRNVGHFRQIPNLRVINWVDS